MIQSVLIEPYGHRNPFFSFPHTKKPPGDDLSIAIFPAAAAVSDIVENKNTDDVQIRGITI